MKLLVVRHAIAMNREDYQTSFEVSGAGAQGAANDDLRPLTLEGIRKMKKNAKGLRKLVDRPDLLLSSPLTRARQTTEILENAWEGIDVEFTDAMRPDAHPDELVDWFRTRPEMARSSVLIAVIGHEPHLSHLVSWLLSGSNRPIVEIKKGGACLIEFDGLPQKSRGTLNWLVTPRALSL